MSHPIAETAAGRIEGRRHGRAMVFRGIPYAADTGGEGRFRDAGPAPAPPAVADQIGPRAPQVLPEGKGPSFFSFLAETSPLSEDCLRLNVFAPEEPGPKRPVMVWLHGGAWISGSGNRPSAHGSILAETGDVVVVTINHRLNAFGFTWDGTDATDPNVGLTDIIKALEWVRDNIAAFGGDPDCVTLFGQSGGGAKVSVLMAMPRAKGLFHRAIVQSASLHIEMATPERAVKCAELLYDELGLKIGDRTGLADVPMEAILKARLRAVARNDGIDDFRPVVDGNALPFDPFSPAGLDHHADIPMIAGSTREEMTFFMAYDGEGVFDMPEARARQMVADFFHMSLADSAPLFDSYASAFPEKKPGQVAGAIFTEARYTRNGCLAADRKAAHGSAPVYRYRVDWQCAPWDGQLGAPHTVCIPLVFGTTETAREMLGRDAQADALSRRMMAAWTQFARTGDPNCDALPHWPRYDATDRPSMIFDAECSVMNDPGKTERELMEPWPAFRVGMILKGIKRAV
ncbi:MAG: carboxylesterase/lipase family protein [Pseudooceanicola atlanticus]